jgi:hypothetical protein
MQHWLEHAPIQLIGTCSDADVGTKPTQIRSDDATMRHYAVIEGAPGCNEQEARAADRM